MIFIDSLNLRSIILAYKLVKGRDKRAVKTILFVLDPIDKTVFSWIIMKVMLVLGISIKEADFFSGDLRTVDGFSIFTTAKHILTKIAYEVAKRTIDESKILSSLNEEWGRNTIRLYISKCIWVSAGFTAHHTIFKILIADALARGQDRQKHSLVIGLPMGITPDLIKDISGTLNLYTYSIKEFSIRKTRLSVLFLIAYVGLKRLMKRTVSIFQPKPEFGAVTTPALLLSQEDDLSMDRSYRAQPHWLFKESPLPEFRTLIMESNSVLRQVPDYNELEHYLIYSVPQKTIYCYSDKHAVQKKINSAIRVLLYQSVCGSRFSVDIAFQLALLFMKASLLAGFCKAQNVKAYMTRENYYQDANAMNLLGPQMGIHTLSYQYSNMSEINPTFLTTADTMCTFSGLFHKRWSNNGIHPKSFTNIGYLFDSSFDLVEERATELRKQLMNNDTQFIICYFDENFLDHKYGIISMQNHYQDILDLAKLVIQDTSTTVIIKTQYIKNSPGIIFKDDKIIESSKATGRFIELFQGKHRNNIFPAEAAMAADLVVGHTIGATAGLEAAVAGSRCILLNPYDMQGSNIEIFKQADILYDNLDSALSAASFYRKGKHEYQNFGDWSSIIDLFDPFRDKQSTSRLRKTIEDCLLE